MSAPWPFAQWGLNIMGPFPTAMRQLKFLVVEIDYFIKWVEVEPLATITEKNVRGFIWKSIIFRFGILVSSSWTMAKNSTMMHSENSTNSWGSKTTIHHLATHKPMVKPKLQIDPCSRWPTLGLRGQRGCGRTNYQVYYGHIEWWLAHLQTKHLFAL